MTTFTYLEIQEKTDKRLQLVRSDTDSATKDSVASLDRIRHRFFDDILFPKLIVKAIRSKQELSSFRIGRNQQINLDVRLEKVLREARSSERSSILGSPGKQGTIGSLNEVSEDGEEEYASDRERALTGESNKIKGKTPF